MLEHSKLEALEPWLKTSAVKRELRRRVASSNCSRHQLKLCRIILVSIVAREGPGKRSGRHTMAKLFWSLEL